MDLLGNVCRWGGQRGHCERVGEDLERVLLLPYIRSEEIGENIRR